MQGNEERNFRAASASTSASFEWMVSPVVLQPLASSRFSWRFYSVWLDARVSVSFSSLCSLWRSLQVKFIKFYFFILFLLLLLISLIFLSFPFIIPCLGESVSQNKFLFLFLVLNVFVFEIELPEGKFS